MKSPRYSLQDWLLGGMIFTYSLELHVTSTLARPVDNTADTQYVNGDTRYMKIQNFGSVDGPASTPQKSRHMLKRTLAMLPPASAVSTRAIQAWAKVQVKTRNCQKSSHMRPDRSAPCPAAL